MKTKKCPTCKQYKFTDDFNKSSRSKDGLQYRCKECTKASSKKPTPKVEASEAPEVTVKKNSTPPHIIEGMLELRQRHKRVLKNYFKHK